MDDLANDIEGNPEAKKAVNEMLNSGVDWDNAVAIAHKQFIGDKKSTVSPKTQKAVELAKQKLDFNRPGEYAEISNNHWSYANISNDKMADLMSKSDSKYEYEHVVEKDGNTIHHRLYRVPKEGKKSTPKKLDTLSPRAQAQKMTESELRAYVKKNNLTKSYNIMMNTRPGAYGYEKQMSVLRDLVTDAIAFEEGKKRRGNK